MTCYYEGMCYERMVANIRRFSRISWGCHYERGCYERMGDKLRGCEMLLGGNML